MALAMINPWRMPMFLRIIISLCCVVCASTSDAQSPTAESIYVMVQEFLRAIDSTYLPVGSGEIQVSHDLVGQHNGVPSYVWNCTDGLRLVSADEATGSILSYENGILEDIYSGGPRSRGIKPTGNPTIDTSKALIEYSKRILSKIGWQIKDRVLVRS